MALKKFFGSLGKSASEGGNMNEDQHQGQGEESSAGHMPVDIDPSDPTNSSDRPEKKKKDETFALMLGGEAADAHYYYEGEDEDRRAVRGFLVVDSSGTVRFESH